MPAGGVRLWQFCEFSLLLYVRLCSECGLLKGCSIRLLHILMRKCPQLWHENAFTSRKCCIWVCQKRVLLQPRFVKLTLEGMTVGTCTSYVNSTNVCSLSNSSFMCCVSRIILSTTLVGWSLQRTVNKVFYCRINYWTAVAQWLRWCATNREVAGSIPAGVIGIFHWHKILAIALWPWGRLSV